MNKPPAAIPLSTFSQEASHPVSCDDPGVYRTLLESTRAIPWRIDWATMRFTYIGPQIEQLLGWSPSSWRSVNDWPIASMKKIARRRSISVSPSRSAAWTMKPTTGR